MKRNFFFLIFVTNLILTQTLFAQALTSSADKILQSLPGNHPQAAEQQVTTPITKKPKAKKHIRFSHRNCRSRCLGSPHYNLCVKQCRKYRC